MALNPISQSNDIKNPKNNKHSSEKTYNRNNETKMWCKFLRVSPEEFFSMSDSEIESRILELEKKHRLEVAENLIAYLKERKEIIRESKENPQSLKHYDERSRAGANFWDILCQAADDMDEMYGDEDEYTTSFEETLETTYDDPSSAWETIDQDTLYMGDRTGFGETFNQTSVDDRTYDVSGIIDETYNISGAEADSYERSWNRPIQQNTAMTSTPKYPGPKRNGCIKKTFIDLDIKETEDGDVIHVNSKTILINSSPVRQQRPVQSFRNTSRSGEYHPNNATQLSQIPMPAFYAGPSTTFTRNTPPPNLESSRGVSMSQRRPMNRSVEVPTPQLPSQNLNSTRTYQTRPSPRSCGPKLTSTRLSRGTPSSCYDTSTRFSQGTPPSGIYDTSSRLSRGTPRSGFNDTSTIQGTPSSYYDITSSYSRGTPSSRCNDTSTRLSRGTPPSGFYDNSTRLSQGRPPSGFYDTSSRLSRGTPPSGFYDNSTRLSQGTPPSGFYDTSSRLSRGTSPSRCYDNSTRLSQVTPPSGLSGVNQNNPYCPIDVRNQSIQGNYSMPGTPARPRVERSDSRRNIFTGC